MRRIAVELVAALFMLAAGCAPPSAGSSAALARGGTNGSSSNVNGASAGSVGNGASGSTSGDSAGDGASGSNGTSGATRTTGSSAGNGASAATSTTGSSAGSGASGSTNAGATGSTSNGVSGSGNGNAGMVPPPPPVPILEFDADWRVQQSNSVISGGKAIIRYDIRRLPNCRATYMSYPAWDILAHWSTDGGPAYSTSLTTVTSAGRVGTDVTIDVPPGRDFAMWFSASDESGCQQWDSSYGANFHFPTEPGPPTIHFGYPGFDYRVDGTLAAGGAVMIDYDIRRLWECRQDVNGVQSWDVTVFYSFDGAPPQSASVTSMSDNGRVAAPALFAAPAGARALAVWFENSDGTRCTAWDSRYGANYAFTLQ